jgi:hypothetical protein
MLEFVSWYSNNDSQTLARKLYGDELGEHATPDEVSITKYLYPELAEKTGYLDPEFVTNVPPGRTARQMEGESSSTRNCHNLTQTLPRNCHNLTHASNDIVHTKVMYDK